MESSEASSGPFGLLSHIHAAVAILLIGVSGKDSIHGVCVLLGELDACTYVQITPWTALGSHVVAERSAQFVDEAYLAISCGVLVGAYLHLHVVGHIQHHVSCLAAAHGSIQHTAEGRVAYCGHVSVGIGLHVGIIEAIAWLAEVGGVGETHRGGEDVSDGLNLFSSEPWKRLIHTI